MREFKFVNRFHYSVVSVPTVDPIEDKHFDTGEPATLVVMRRDWLQDARRESCEADPENCNCQKQPLVPEPFMYDDNEVWFYLNELESESAHYVAQAADAEAAYAALEEEEVQV